LAVGGIFVKGSMKKASSRKTIGKAHVATSNPIRERMDAEDREVGKLLASHKGRIDLGPEYPGYAIDGDTLSVTGSSAAGLLRMCAESEGHKLVQFVKDVIARNAKAAKRTVIPAELEMVQYFPQLGQGFGLDKAGNLFFVQGECRHTYDWPKGIREAKPTTFKRALQWIAKRETIEGLDGDFDHERFYELIAEKLPQGV